MNNAAHNLYFWYGFAFDMLQVHIAEKTRFGIFEHCIMQSRCRIASAPAIMVSTTAETAPAGFSPNPTPEIPEWSK